MQFPQLFSKNGIVQLKFRALVFAVIGNVYEYGTPESDLALRLLHEPNCRHRSVVFFDDFELDTPAEFFEEQKMKVGLRYEEKKEKWVFVP